MQIPVQMPMQVPQIQVQQQLQQQQPQQQQQLQQQQPQPQQLQPQLQLEHKFVREIQLAKLGAQLMLVVSKVSEMKARDGNSLAAAFPVFRELPAAAAASSAAAAPASAAARARWVQIRHTSAERSQDERVARSFAVADESVPILENGQTLTSCFVCIDSLEVVKVEDLRDCQLAPNLNQQQFSALAELFLEQQPKPSDCAVGKPLGRFSQQQNHYQMRLGRHYYTATHHCYIAPRFSLAEQQSREAIAVRRSVSVIQGQQIVHGLDSSTYLLSLPRAISSLLDPRRTLDSARFSVAEPLDELQRRLIRRCFSVDEVAAIASPASAPTESKGTVPAAGSGAATGAGAGAGAASGAPRTASSSPSPPAPSPSNTSQNANDPAPQSSESAPTSAAARTFASTTTLHAVDCLHCQSDALVSHSVSDHGCCSFLRLHARACRVSIAPSRAAWLS